jgi:hypothetical protein
MRAPTTAIGRLRSSAKAEFRNVRARMAVALVESRFGNPAEIAAGQQRRNADAFAATQAAANRLFPAPCEAVAGGSMVARAAADAAAADAAPRTDVVETVFDLARRIQTEQQFAELYRFHAMTQVPDALVIDWANSVDEIVHKAATATDVAEASNAVVALQIAAATMLPTNRPLMSVMERLRERNPFHLGALTRGEGGSDGGSQSAHTTQDAAPAVAAEHQRESRSGDAAAAAASSSFEEARDAAVAAEHQRESRSGDAAAALSSFEEARDAADRARRQCEEDDGALLRRLAAAIHRLFADSKVRRARGLVEAFAEHGRADISFADKLAKIKAKILPRQQEIPARAADLKHVPTPSGSVVRDALARMPKDAATCIERLTPRLLLQAIAIQPRIATHLGVVVGRMLNGQYEERVYQFLRLGRIVGVPKPEPDRGAVRPITISSFFAKLVGSIAMHIDEPKCSVHQFAMSRKNGCQTVVFNVREEYERGDAVIRFDVKNAFGTAQRHRIAAALDELSVRDNKEHTHIRRYFDLMYRPHSHVVAFGPHRQREFIPFDEGSKQGDSPSTLFFNLLLDVVIRDIVEGAKACGVTLTKVRAYVDDLTITAPPEHAMRAHDIAVAALRKHGFELNADKSKILVRDPQQLGEAGVEVCNDSQSFVVLGGNITSEYGEYNARQRARTDAFLLRLRQVPLHPQVAFTLARLCGGPRLKFYASVTPPEKSSDLLRHLQAELVAFVKEALGFAEIPDASLHSRWGLGLPNYARAAPGIYDAMRRHVLQGHSLVEVALATTEPPRETEATLAAHLRHQQAAEWCFYVPPSPNGTYLTATEFRVAMALRCRATLQAHSDNVTLRSCKCGSTFQMLPDMLEHVLSCPQCDFSSTTRHNDVMRALTSVAREYGIAAKPEPKDFRGAYPDGIEHRPDITFATVPVPVVTDVSVCKHDDDAVGAAAQRRAGEKCALHSAPIAKCGALFIPFVLEQHGTRDARCKQLLQHVSATLPPYLQHHFVRRATLMTSIALAKARVAAVMTFAAWASNKHLRAHIGFAQPGSRIPIGSNGDEPPPAVRASRA